MVAIYLLAGGMALGTLIAWAPALSRWISGAGRAAAHRQDVTQSPSSPEVLGVQLADALNELRTASSQRESAEVKVEHALEAALAQQQLSEKADPS